MARDAEKFVNVDEANVKVKQKMNVKRTSETVVDKLKKQEEKKRKRTKTTTGTALVVPAMASNEVK